MLVLTICTEVHHSSCCKGKLPRYETGKVSCCDSANVLHTAQKACSVSQGQQDHWLRHLNLHQRGRQGQPSLQQLVAAEILALKQGC